MWDFAFAPLLLVVAVQAAPSKNLDWTWDRTTPACSLQQSISADGTIVSVSRTPGVDSTALYVGGTAPLIEPQKTYDDASITFSPGGIAKSSIYVTAGGERRDLLIASTDPDFLSKFAQASSIELSQEKFGTTSVRLRSAGAAAEALRQCEDSRMRDWGIDPVAWRALGKRPQPAKGGRPWFSGSDYPVSAIWEGLQGYSISRVEVGADGAVKTCVSLNRNRAANARDRMCTKLMHRARFEPALDGSGKPVSAPYVVLVKFQLG